MAPTITATQLMKDGFAAPLDWKRDVIGMNVDRVNVQVSTSGAGPAALDVELAVRCPNGKTDITTLKRPIRLSVPYDKAAGKYRLSRAVSDVAPFLALDKRKEMAAVARKGATSHEEMARGLGWACRGIGIQGQDGDPTTGTPHARTLMLAGGVEVLEVAVVSPGAAGATAKAVGLVRSPADLFYYSGHGRGATNTLLLEYMDGYVDWIKPADVVKAWAGLRDMDILVIAGCSVLKVEKGLLGGVSGPGLEWAKLLTSKGGQLTALLGYAGSAPLDNPVGNAVAADMAAKIAGGSKAFVKDWLTINAARLAWNACGIDARGYWHLSRFDAKVGADPIEGPIAI